METNEKPSRNPEIKDQQQGENIHGVVFKDQIEFICHFLPDFTLTYVNQACCRHFGFSHEDLMDQSFMTLISKENRAIVCQHLFALSPDRPVVTFEQRTVSPIGEIQWQEWINHAIFTDSGDIAKFQTIGRDITKSKLSEMDLEKTERLYRSVVEDQVELVARCRPDFKLTFANEAYCRHHGKKLNELIGKSFLPYIQPEDREEIVNFIKSADPNHPVITIVQCITNSNGETVWVEWCRRALFDDSGKLYEIQGVGRDITEFKKAEAALKVSEEAMRKKNIELKRKNTALTEVLEQIEHQKQRVKDDVIANVDKLIIPALENLISKSSKIDNKYLILIKRSLEDLTSSFGRKITQKSLKLTPREVQICNMIKKGLSSKEIARLLNISLFTVGRHRHNTRKKVNITNKNINLNSFLQSL